MGNGVVFSMSPYALRINYPFVWSGRGRAELSGGICVLCMVVVVFSTSYLRYWRKGKLAGAIHPHSWVLYLVPNTHAHHAHTETAEPSATRAMSANAIRNMQYVHVFLLAFVLRYCYLFFVIRYSSSVPLYSRPMPILCNTNIQPSNESCWKEGHFEKMRPLESRCL